MVVGCLVAENIRQVSLCLPEDLTSEWQWWTEGKLILLNPMFSRPFVCWSSQRNPKTWTRRISWSATEPGAALPCRKKPCVASVASGSSVWWGGRASPLAFWTLSGTKRFQCINKMKDLMEGVRINYFTYIKLLFLTDSGTLSCTGAIWPNKKSPFLTQHQRGSCLPQNTARHQHFWCTTSSVKGKTTTLGFSLTAFVNAFVSFFRVFNRSKNCYMFKWSSV